ncbi:MAG: GNAT family N-acetyltransferase [Lachnospiraceae bacterium]|nr:GNAT family N-acetyltransferase [Lachnospiraceae bacterium]
MYFLKKIYAVIENKEARQEMERWAQVYQNGFFQVEIYGIEELLMADGVEVRLSEEAPVTQENTLWITDAPYFARMLQESKKEVPALAYLHEDDSGEYTSGIGASDRDRDFSCCRYAMMHPLELDAEYFELIYRRLKRLPWDILETERCTLRESTVADVPAFYEIYKEPSITAYMENLFLTPEEENAYMEDYIDKVYAYYDFGVWTVLEKATGQVIGRAGLSYREGFEDPELGFVIGVPWQGQGLAYEVCSAILDYGRRVLDFERVQVFVEPGNEASLSLCRKLGFKESEPLTLDGKKYMRLIAIL